MNFTNEFTFTKLKNTLNFNSINTVQNYLSYLEEAYLFFSLNRFSFKVKEQIKTAKKNYLVDNGFVLAKSFQPSQDLGKLMANLVFTELVKQGFEPNENIFYYKTRNQKEIDFALKEGTKIKNLIQVVYQFSDPNIQKREIESLIEASQELKCDNLAIITWDTEKEEKFYPVRNKFSNGVKDKKIKFIPLWK